MIKRTPSRNTRSRRFKVKHVLQICLLLGVCFWLVYQVKHSHDKKKEFEGKDAKTAARTQSSDDITNLGRKGLLPRVQEMSKDDKHEEEDEEETTLEEEVNKVKENELEQKQVEDETKREAEEREEEVTKYEEGQEEEGNKNEDEEEREGGNKHEEEGREEDSKREEEEREEGIKHEDEEQEEDTKSDETEDEGRGGGDDEIDERDQEKIEGEADHEEDFVDEEKEREEEGDGKESRNDEGEDKEDQIDQEASTEDQDHGGGAQNDHEAREVHYKADDASSAVTHDTQLISTEPEKVSSEDSNEISVTNKLELEKNNNDDINGDQKNSTLQLKDGGSDPSLNVTDGENKGDEVINSEDQLPKNATNDSISNNQIEASNNPVDGSNEISGTSQKNETTITYDSNQPQNASVGGAGEASNVKTTELEQVNNNITSGSKGLDSDSTAFNKTENNGAVAGDSKSTTISELDGSDETIKPEVTGEAEVNNGSTSTTNETTDTSQDENSEIKSESGGTDENAGSTGTDGTGDVHDPIDSSDSSIGQDEKDARIDLSTLPENSSEGINSRDAAAE